MKHHKIKAIILPPVLFALWLASCDNKQAGNNDALTEAEVRTFISGYDKMWNGRDTTGLKEVMDDKYIYFSSVGTTSSKSNSLAMFTPADKYRIDTAARTEISVILNGNTAIVNSRWIGSGVYNGEPFNDNQRCGIVVQKTNNRIRIISEHCVQVTK